MSLEYKILGDLLSDPLIREVAGDAVRNLDLRQEELWNKTLAQLREDHIFSGELGNGIQRLYRAAETGAWYYPLYTAEECEEDEARRGVNLVWFPSDAPEADEKPWILLVPGGGFVNVWNLTEGWPVGNQYNSYGYHVFILTYQVDGQERLLEKNMEDFARAIRFVRDRADRFRVSADRYITCGFSAGGYLVCLWNTRKGYPLHGLPKPQACFPVYPVVSLKESIRYGSDDPEESIRLYGCPLREAAETEFEIPEHAEGFPPTAIFLSAGDELVDPENSKMLARALEALKIPCRLEIGPEGGHGFADGSGMCMEGWTERAVRWFESL